MESVPLRVEDEASLPGGGYARLIFEGLGRRSGSAVTVTLRRGVEADPWLGPRGWQAGDHAFTPYEVRREGEDLVVVLGPEVSAQIEDYTTVQAMLPELAASGVVNWEGVTKPFAVEAPPPRREAVRVPFELLPGGAIAFEDATEALGALAPAKRSAEGAAVLGVDYAALRRCFRGELQVDPETGAARPLRTGEPPGRIVFTADTNGGLRLRGENGSDYQASVTKEESVFGLTSADLTAQSEGVLELDPETLLARLVQPPKIEVTPAEPQEESKRAFAWVLPLLVFCFISGGVAYLLYERNSAQAGASQTAEADPPPQEEAEAPPETTPPPTQEAEAPPEEEAPPEPQPPTAAELFAQGVEAHRAGETDKARLLLRQAQHQGHPPAALYLAKEVDSIDFEAGLFAEPDDIEALGLYAKACAAEIAEAVDAVAALREVLKAKADEGDILARETLEGPLVETEEICQ